MNETAVVTCQAAGNGISDAGELNSGFLFVLHVLISGGQTA
jgi:hypothetical protein